MIRALLICAVATAAPPALAQAVCDSHHFCTRFEADGATAQLIGRNLNPHVPITVKLWPAGLDGDDDLDAAVASPPAIVVPPGAEHMLATVQRNADGDWSDLPDVDWAFGDFRATPDPDKPHLLPWPQDLYFGTLRYFVSQGCNGDFSHTGNRAYATDFAMPEGAKVSAARGGIVFEVEERFDQGGEDEALFDAANVVQILHEDGSISMYAHLQKDGALISEGDHVIAGDAIALSGNTGYSTGAHLHFERYIAGDQGYILSLPTRFRHWGGEATCPKTGASMGAK